MPDSPAVALTHPALALAGVRHGFFTRRGGVSEGIYASLNGGQGSADDPALVRENRRRMADALGVAGERFVTCYQVHSPDVITVVAPWTRETAPKADAMVTREKGLAIAVSTADCGPVLFADAEAGVVGAAHAGWKGAFTGVLEATLAAMEGLGATRAGTVAVLGPMISKTAYEVGPEFVARFVEVDAANAAFFGSSPREGHAMFDLPAYIRARLTGAGIGRFEDMALCTYADEERFFSYRRVTHRREPDYGRLLHAIALA
ncbi:peptidoglycan editing factor PgeF [Labrys wisconsinensis]|uniref:Purine nucleoside phosphorylase n=1 Tax=Labrys wisconsinensis TaxID=425677 RepID=A0ABU0JHC8_9HYPH|nr:peptidoglycan editing factor PgeF [Labrys wisconsinensis]MDQ0473674.1 YfiH family protein [Labrys wisconsinensis]